MSLNEIEHAILRAPLPIPKGADRLPGNLILSGDCFLLFLVVSLLFVVCCLLFVVCC